MVIDILTLFPSMLEGPFAESIIKIAQEKGLVKINIHNLRAWAKDKHNTVDDKPYGGGPGMVLKCQPVFDAVEELTEGKTFGFKSPDSAGTSTSTNQQNSNQPSPINNKQSPPEGGPPMAETILLTPQGNLFNQKKAKELAKLDYILLICGHYEGIDERVRQHLVDEELSIGDYILTGGEIPAMVVTDAVIRLIPGVLSNQATAKESFMFHTTNEEVPGTKLLEPPQYTRPANFRGWEVPEILLSGNHQQIVKWREKKATERTKKRRPDLL